MSTWVLLLWFATSSNYIYNPTIIGEWNTKQSCEVALAKFKTTEHNHPDGVCLEKPEKPKGK